MRTTGVLLAGLLVAAGCVGPSVQSNAPHHVRPDGLVQGPHVNAGSAFAVRFDTALDTQTSYIGQPFTAHVVNPLADESGALLVPANAIIRGHVVSLGSVDAPRIRLQFDSIDTVNGPARFDATVRHAEHQHYPGPVEFRPAPMVGYFDSPYIYPFDYQYHWGAIGGGPWMYGYEPFRPSEVHVPVGAELQLVLTRPLVPPGSSVVR